MERKLLADTDEQVCQRFGVIKDKDMYGRKVRDIVMEPLAIWKRGSVAERDTKVDSLLEEVGIDPARAAESQPHQFSGGQCQRISIARSLVLDPSLIICDEPVSALDVSVQAQVLNLLEDLKAKHGLTMIFIAHDLAVVKNISDRIAVMYLGKICEVAPSDALYQQPAHHYTGVLLDSIPVPDPEVEVSKVAIDGEPPSPVLPPAGCRFNPRCPAADDRCRSEEPELREIGAHGCILRSCRGARDRAGRPSRAGGNRLHDGGMTLVGGRLDVKAEARRDRRGPRRPGRSRRHRPSLRC